MSKGGASHSVTLAKQAYTERPQTAEAYMHCLKKEMQGDVCVHRTSDVMVKTL